LQSLSVMKSTEWATSYGNEMCLGMCPRTQRPQQASTRVMFRTVMMTLQEQMDTPSQQPPKHILLNSHRLQIAVLRMADYLRHNLTRLLVLVRSRSITTVTCLLSRLHSSVTASNMNNTIKPCSHLLHLRRNRKRQTISHSRQPTIGQPLGLPVWTASPHRSWSQRPLPHLDRIDEIVMVLEEL
jgi:hypothetical protein